MMKYAQQILLNGGLRIVDASGCHLGNGDADTPVLHVLPKLLVPADALATKPRWSPHFRGLCCENVTLTVTSTLPGEIIPEGGVIIRQPYPNRRYFVAGSALIRNGWIVPLPLDVTEFDIQLSWQFEGAWQVFRADEWEVRHLLHIKLHPGKGMTYSMDGACWPQRDGPAMKFSPVTPLGVEEEDPVERTHRQIVRDRDLTYADGELAGYFLEERVDITGIPLDQAWTIDAFQEEQLHEVEQTAVLKQDNEAHRANGPVEMPAELLVRAIKLAEEVPFAPNTEFAKSVTGIPGGLERHPAMQLLCAWWDMARPQDEPFKPGSAMPMVRVRDDGEYWMGHYETPNAPVEDFNPSGRDTARIGDFLLVLFQATQNSATFDEDGMHIMLPSGEPYSCIGIEKKDYLSGEIDEAAYGLKALVSFPSRFPAAWKFLNQKGGEYAAARREQVAVAVPLPDGVKSCPTCHGMPVLTEDPTDQSRSRCRLECGEHFRTYGATVEEVVAEWNDDYNLLKLGADPDLVALR